MAKKPFFNSLRVFMAVGSLVGFAGGWTLLAQSGAPASAADTTTAIVVSAQAQRSQHILSLCARHASRPGHKSYVR